MFNFFFKKALQIETLIFTYLETLKKTQKNFSDALDACLTIGGCGNFNFLAEQTHKYESKADDIREDIKTLMYGKALIPESRGDIMGLLEAMDLIPGIFEDILQTISTQKMSVPGFILSDIQELIKISLETCDLMTLGVATLFQKKEGIRSMVTLIDQNESQCDHIQRRIIGRIFDSELEPFHMLQLKELISMMGQISDQADRVSKRVNIINMKRMV